MRSGLKQALALAGVVIAFAGCAPLQHARWSQAQEEAEERDGPPEGDYWALRVGYPANEFRQSWLIEAARQDAAIARAVPQGEKKYMRSALSPLALDPAAFTPLGPLPLDNGGAGNNFGHVSGRANVIAVDPVDTSVAYFGSDGGGVWKTTTCCSASTTWAVKTDIAAISASSIDDITIDPNNHNVVYAATGDLNYGSFSFGAAGVLKSTDQGEHWSVLGENVFNAFYGPSAGGYPQYQAVGKVVVDPNNSNIVVAGTKTGVFFSYDAGANWSGPCYTNAFSSGASAQRQDTTGLIAVNVAGATTLYAAVGTRGTPTPVQPDLGKNGANGVYRTAMPASGCPASWTLLNSGWPANTGNGTAGGTSIGRIELAVAPSDHQTLYALVSDTTTTNGVLGVWKTVNGGTSWTAGATGAGFTGCSNAGTQMWYDSGLTVDPNNANIVIASAVDVFRSSNGGTGFTNLTCGYSGGNVHVDQHARAYVGTDSNKLLVGNDGGVYYSANAAAASPTFTQLNESINTIETYAGDITANFATSASPGASSGQQDNGCSAAQWSSTPSAKLWTATNSGDGFFTRIEPVKGKVWYYESQNAGMVKTSNGPFSIKSGAAPSFTNDRKGFITPFEIYKYGDTAITNSGCDAVSGCTHLIAGGAKVWETINGATSWTAKTADLTKNTLVLGADNRSLISQLAYSVTDVTKAIVGTTDGNVQYLFGLGGAGSATVVNLTGANAVLPNRPIQDVATDPLDPLIGYAAIGGFDQNTPTTPGHLYRVVCTANCASFAWTDKSGNLPNIPVNSVIANPHLPNQVFAGTDWGLYFTNDITAAAPLWSRFEGLPHAMIWDMSIDRGFTTLAVFTRSRGVWVWPLPTAPVTPPQADLVLTKSGPANAIAGNDIVYTITVTNNGPDTANNVSVTDATPAGLSFVGNAGNCVTAFPCSLGNMASGSSKTITATFHVPANFAGSNVANTASAGSATSDPVPGNNAATANTAVTVSSDVRVTLAGPASVLAGTQASYTLGVKDLGPSDVANVDVNLPTPAGWNVVSVNGAGCSALPCSIGPLPANAADSTITVVFAVPPDYSGATPVTLQARISAGADPVADNDSASVDTAVTAQADLGVAVAGPASVVPGKRLSYTVTLSNNGPSTASALSVNATLPAGLTWAGNSGDCTTAFPCSFATLAPGASRAITVSACVPANYATNPVPLSASASSATADAASGNNSNTLNLPLDLDVLFIDGFDSCP